MLLVGYLDLGARLSLEDITVRNGLGRILYSDRSTPGASELASSTTLALADGRTWSAICWSRRAGPLIPYLFGAGVVALVGLAVGVLAYSLRQARDHHQSYLHGKRGDQITMGWVGRGQRRSASLAVSPGSPSTRRACRRPRRQRLRSTSEAAPQGVQPFRRPLPIPLNVCRHSGGLPHSASGSY